MHLHHERRGSGPPLVLLHGVGHRWQGWEPVLDKLATEHDVYAVDLPGFGESAFEGRIDIHHAVARLAAFFKTAGIENPHIVGNSLGGLIALEMGIAGHAASVTAISPAGIWNRRQRLYTLSVLIVIRMLSRTPKPIIRAMMKTRPTRFLACGMLFGKPSQLDPDVFMADVAAFRAGRGFWPVLREGFGYEYLPRRFDVPVTIAWGTKDRIMPKGQSKRARRQIPAARFVSLPGLGHVPMSDDPDLVAQTILETTAATR